MIYLMAEGGGVVIDKNSLVKEIGQHYKKTPCLLEIYGRFFPTNLVYKSVI